MDEKRLAQLLHEIAHEEIPDDMNLLPGIQTAARKTSRAGRLVPRSRIGWAAVIIAVLLSVGAGVYAVDYVLQNLDPGLQAADNDNLIVHFNETQTIGDVSVTLEYAYADANRIAIAYNGRALVPGNLVTNIGFTNIHLSDNQGRSFDQYLFGGGGGGGGSNNDSYIAETSFSMLDSYDASIITDSPAELNLQLEITVGDTRITGMQAGDSESTMPTPEVTGEPFEPVTFTFEFTIPFNSGLVMDEAQTVTAADLAVTLNRVVVTPSLTRLEICFEQPPSDDPFLYWMPVASLTIDGEEVMAATEIGRDVMAMNSDAACINYNVATALHDQPGEWVLHVEKLLLPAFAAQEEMRQALMEHGVETIDHPDGGWTYNTPPEMSRDELGNLIQEINAQYRRTIEGPWVFTFRIG